MGYRAGATLQMPVVVVIYHVTIVAIGHGLLKSFWPLVNIVNTLQASFLAKFTNTKVEVETMRRKIHRLDNLEKEMMKIHEAYQVFGFY